MPYYYKLGCSNSKRATKLETQITGTNVCACVCVCVAALNMLFVVNIWCSDANNSAFQWHPRFTNGIYWEAGLFLRTPFTEGCDGANYQTLPPGRSNVLYF